MAKRGLIVALVVMLLGAALLLGDWIGRQRAAPTATATSSASTAAARKPLYYRNPMGLADTSPVPKKDSMGMDYIPVFAEEEGESGSGFLQISPAKVQKLGVKTAPVSLQVLATGLRVLGRVEVDERKRHVIAPRFEGYLERLYVNTSGQAVSKGQVLFEVYSPELASAQSEYALAMEGLAALQESSAEAQRGMRELAAASLARLRNWELDEAQIKRSASPAQGRARLAIRSPVSGVVSEMRALQGMRFMAGEMLYQINDLSSVWVVAEVFPQDLALLKLGSAATVRLAAYPGQRFEGRIAFIAPTLNEATRTVTIRVELANPQGLLKPAMFAEVEIAVGATSPVLSVPDSAVIDSGRRRVVLVQRGEGRFEAREVETGARSDQRIEVRHGLRQGEQVVVAANFLLDAESNLQAALQGMEVAASAPASAPQATHSTH